MSFRLPFTSSAPMISVIVVNWNRRALLAECLQSLAAQQGANFEVIVVDNGSTDDSADFVLQNYVHDGPFPCRLIANPDNRGFCAANNQGIAASSGEFVALLNNDAVAMESWLAELLTAFDSPDVGMAASKILVKRDPARIDKVGHLIFADGQNRGRGTGEIDHGQYDRREEVAWPDGCAAMYRRSMLDEIGGFDEDLFAYADDAELGLRARIGGWRCLYIPEAVVHHERGATMGVASTARLRLIERNRVLLAVKLFPWSLLVLNPFFYFARLVAGVRAALAGRGETVRYPGASGKIGMALALVRGDLAAMRLVPRMLAKRREIERFRKLTPTQVRRLLWRYRIPLRVLCEQAN
jgi:GT2 family glycosyltransferase